MKILNKKVLIVIILFFSFLIFNNSNCFAKEIELKNGLKIPDSSYIKEYNFVFIANSRYYIFTSSDSFDITEFKTYFDGLSNSIKFKYSTHSDFLYMVEYYPERNYFNPYYTVCSATNFSTYFDIRSSNLSLDTPLSDLIYYSDMPVISESGDNIFSPEPETPKVTPTLYIDDQNLKKRFKFQFEIPLEKEDTKYYVFLQKYTRNSYDSVTATFTIYTVSTPEGYDATDYENYMYYDLPSRGLYLPAGCSIKEYKITSANNDRGNLELINEFVSERITDDFSKDDKYLDLQKQYLIYLIENSNNTELSSSDFLKTLLFPVDFSVYNVNYGNFFYNLLKYLPVKIPILNIINEKGENSVQSYKYNFCLKYLYYSKKDYISLSFEDLAFSNYTIVSYENERTDNSKSAKVYNIYRKTKVYNQENKINDNMFAFNYSDGQDVSSLLPDGLDVGYLTSPWFKDNEKSTSKGNITYDINEIIQGDKIIDYSKEDNSIHNNFNGDYIENFKEGDNITINNYYTETIEKTSDSHLLHNIYVAILEIKQLLSSTNDKISNTTNNLTYNVSNTVTYLFVPTSLGVQTDLEKLDNSAKEHLGIIYEPFDLLIYTVTLFTNIDNSTEIVLSAPAVSWKDHEIIPVTNFSFNQFFDQAPKFKEIHDIYLMSVDFIVIGLLLYLAYKKFKEVFNK